MVVIVRYVDEIMNMKKFAKNKRLSNVWIGKQIGCTGNEVGMWFNRNRPFPKKRFAQIKELLDSLKEDNGNNQQQ